MTQHLTKAEGRTVIVNNISGGSSTLVRASDAEGNVVTAGDFFGDSKPKAPAITAQGVTGAQLQAFATAQPLVVAGLLGGAAYLFYGIAAAVLTAGVAFFVNRASRK